MCESQACLLRDILPTGHALRRLEESWTHCAKSQNSKRSGARDRLGTRADRQLREGPLEVRLHRLRRNLEGPRDALVGKTLADHAKDIALPRGEQIADAGRRGATGRMPGIP